MAQKDYNEKASAKGPPLKIGNDHKLAAYIEDKIVRDKFSPDAVLMEIERSGKEFSVTLSKTTLYRYIYDDLFMGLTARDLPCGNRPRKKKINKKQRICYKDPLKESIENRPPEIDDREEFGHWEMDTVYGTNSGKSSCLLVLTERKTRDEIAIKIATRTANDVISALNRMERRFERRCRGSFAQTFKTITVDNGSEFSDWEGIETSWYKKGGKRTKVYFCHPFSSFERGSNENGNRLIRRFIPKGAKISDYSDEEIERITRWMNHYPRRLLGGKASIDLFEVEMSSLAA